MIVGLYFNLVMAKKPLSCHKIGIKLLSKLTVQLNSKLKTTIDLDRCDYI